MKIAVFSIALNGYSYRYRKCISSHKRYAAKNNCDYFLFTKPLWINRPAICSWLKVPLFLGLFQKGYDAVFYLDADCYIGSDTPSIATTFINDPGSIFLSNGHSGRINAGVIFSKKSSETIKAFQVLIDEFNTPISKPNQAPYENGHVIQYFTPLKELTILSRSWNSTTEVVGNKGITHYTGPNKSLYTFPAFATFYTKGLKKAVSKLFQSKIHELKSMPDKDYLLYCANVINKEYL